MLEAYIGCRTRLASDNSWMIVEAVVADRLVTFNAKKVTLSVTFGIPGCPLVNCSSTG